MPDKRFVYDGAKFPEPRIAPVRYNRDFFNMELDLESDLFYELRKKNKIEPARLNESSPEELAEIEDFFLKHKDTFYFLFHENGELIGSILHVHNYIQSLAVSRKYQRQGYGEKLTRYCVNRILEGGYASVKLNVLEGNIDAEKLYEKLEFTEIN